MSVKKSITLPKRLDQFVMRRARARARMKGEKPNFSAELANLIVEARQARPLKEAA